MLRIDEWMWVKVEEGRRKMSSVRLVWEDVLKTRPRETQCGDSQAYFRPS